jgi:hypothetical protein
MISASELKLNNLVQDEDGCVFKVIRLWGSGGEWEDEMGDIDFKSEEAFGIPLTTKILTIVGLHQNLPKNAWWDAEENILIDDTKDGYFLAVWVGSQLEPQLETIGKPIRYVHELQNIYQAINRTELQINL